MKVISLIMALLTALTCVSTGKLPTVPTEEMRDISTMELVREMGFGINLGNTLEACGDWIDNSSPINFEKAWGSPEITKKTIQGYADAGFGVIRIPVAWSNMMKDDGTYTISKDYAARVRQVVDWALGTGMYVIVNIHYDNGWVNKFPENIPENMKKFTAIWKQVSELFADCGDKLVFEAQNEELGWESLWNRYSGSEGADKRSSYDLVNRVNQAFVDTVRATGGNNAKRHLLISGYNTDITLTCDKLFRIPDDPAGRIAVSVHYYDPSTLTIIDKDVSWGKAKTDWGSSEDLEALDRNVALLKTTFIDKGIPVIVGEYGCFGENKTKKTRQSYMLDVSSRMYAIGACPILWDTPGNQYDRQNAVFSDPTFIRKLISPSKQ